MRRRRPHQVRFLLLFCIGCFILEMGCGVKAPPVPPDVTVPPNVADLNAEVIGDTVRLSWTLPKSEDVVFPGVKYFRVYKHRVPVSDELCEGCPIPFERVGDIKLDDPEPAWMEQGRMIWEDKIEPDYRYAYMVVVHHETGGVSKDSNIVQFVTEP